MKRRTALKTLGALAGSAALPRVLTGCSSDGEPGGNSNDGITTVVALMMENRSYDHFLGARSLLEGKPGNGLVAGMGNRDHSDALIEVFHDTVACIPDPPHSWNESHAQFSAGTNAGFMTSYQNRYGNSVQPHALGYLTRDELPVTWALADHFTSCDAWHCSIMGPTWPNRMFWHSAQSGGLKVNTLSDSGSLDWPTIHHRLDDAGVPWAYYYSDLPVVGLWGNLPLDERLKRVSWDFFDDAAAGTLPPVTFVDPAFTYNDDHPPHHPILGQQFISSIYNALANSPQWNNILFVVTYDEHGGFFDHVAPPTVMDDRADEGFDQLGFRVPTLVAGPYAKQGYVSSVQYDHTSVLAHIERMFDLEPLTMRDAHATDLTDCIDLERLAAVEPAPPPQVPAVEVDEAQLGDACMTGHRRPRALARLADTGFFGQRDLRSEIPELVQTLGEVLERFNAGGLRRRS